MAPKGAVRFKRLAGAEMRWRYLERFPYGQGRPGTRVIMPHFKDKLTHALVDLWILSGLGPADQIVSAGAWVPEGTNGRGPNDTHVLGIAIDIDAFHWPGESLIAHPKHSEPDFYLGAEAHFRCYFHTVLGWSYNAAHRGHWHIQYRPEKLKPCMASSAMHTRFRQAVLKHVWHDDGNPYYTGAIDGEWGQKSKAAWKRLQKRLLIGDVHKDLAEWIRFLRLSAVQGLRVQ